MWSSIIDVPLTRSTKWWCHQHLVDVHAPGLDGSVGWPATLPSSGRPRPGPCNCSMIARLASSKRQQALLQCASWHHAGRQIEGLANLGTAGWYVCSIFSRMNSQISFCRCRVPASAIGPLEKVFQGSNADGTMPPAGSNNVQAATIWSFCTAHGCRGPSADNTNEPKYRRRPYSGREFFPSHPRLGYPRGMGNRRKARSPRRVPTTVLSASPPWFAAAAALARTSRLRLVAMRASWRTVGGRCGGSRRRARGAAGC
jgi:hypothetical protein